MRSRWAEESLVAQSTTDTEPDLEAGYKLDNKMAARPHSAGPGAFKPGRHQLLF